MTLRDIISFNKGFKSGINLYLSLNKEEKIRSYIPTASSLRILDDYLQAALQNKEQATLLIGPYGKGKSHLLLVLLAILSMERNEKNAKIIDSLVLRIDTEDKLDNSVKKTIKKAWAGKPFLPIILNSTNGDLNQTFLMALNEALTRVKLSGLVPDTFYSLALSRIDDWKQNYPDTYKHFEEQLDYYGANRDEFQASLKMFSSDALTLFKEIYPTVTAGSEFNPLAVSDVLPLYKNISEQLVENYGYSGIYIVFDEFSKFIEGQDGKLVGNNMKLLQDICELASESQNAKVFVTMVAHKGIKEYGKYLSQETINAFTGIEGRIVEKYFVTSSKNNYELIKDAIVKKDGYESLVPNNGIIFGAKTEEKYYSLPAFKTNFTKNDFDNIILHGCYPLNPVAAYLLLNLSEKVAQNERTLFTFISNDEPNSLNRYVNRHTFEDAWVVGADLIYDYFKGLFKKDVSNELVHNIWLSTEYALDRCETDDEKKIIKALAIVLASNKEDELPATDTVLKLAVITADYDAAIKRLLERELIYKRRSTGTYAFKTKAGSALKVEIKKQRELRAENINYSHALEQVMDVHYVIPRKYNTELKMTRYFEHEFMDVASFLNIQDATPIIGDAIDGKVITLYSFTNVVPDDVKKHFSKLGCDQLVVVVPKEKLTIRKQLADFDILQSLKEQNVFNGDDEVLKREFPIIEDDITQEVTDELEGIYGKESDACVLSIQKRKVVEEKAGSEEQAVNTCCFNLYRKSPLINNEIINRNVVSSVQTKKARLNIITALLTHTDDEEFYAGTNQEATIYRSLFIRTGLKGQQVVPDRFLLETINIINNFIDSCSDNKTVISGLIHKLTSAPYGMRKGILPIYLAYVFAERNEDLIFYLSGMEVQLDANVVVNLVEEAEEYELFVSKRDIEKEKYLGELNTLFKVTEQRNLTDNRIKNIVICMQRWFRNLPQTARNMANSDLVEEKDGIKDYMHGICGLLQQLEVNPYEMLFVSFPGIFRAEEFSIVGDRLAEVVTAFEDYLDQIVSIVLKKTCEIFGVKKDLNYALKEWYEKQSLLSKEGLHDGKITALMSFVANLDIYDDTEIAKRLAKVVTGVYIESWANGAVNEYAEELTRCKSEIEQIREENTGDKPKLIFKGSAGKIIEKYYDRAPEGTGTVLRNIIEDALDEYDDLSVNDRVSILLDMIEKILG